MLNSKERNDVGSTVHNITQWHIDRNLVNGSTDDAQAVKLLEEYIELLAAINPSTSPTELANKVMRDTSKLLSTGKIKTVEPENAQAALVDAIGDMMVVQINILERNKVTLKTALQSAYEEIRYRTGKMIDGIFVKEA